MILYRLKKCGIDVSKTRKMKSPDASEKYKDKSWLTKQLKSGKSFFAIAKECKVSFASFSRQVYKLVPAQTIEAGRELRAQAG